MTAGRIGAALALAALLLALAAWRFGAVATLAALVGAGAAAALALLLLLYVPLRLRVSLAADGAPGRRVDVAGGYLLGLLRFTYAQPLPGGGRYRLTLLGFRLLEGRVDP